MSSDIARRGLMLVLSSPSGAGKTTLLKALIGMLPAKGGSVTLGGQELVGLPSYRRVAAGLGFVPQGRMIFPQLTVEENVLAGMERAVVATIPFQRLMEILEDLVVVQQTILEYQQQQEHLVRDMLEVLQMIQQTITEQLAAAEQVELEIMEQEIIQELVA